MLQILLQDARWALGNLTKLPGQVSALVGTIGLGIGATTTLFSVVYGVLLRPLPYPDPERLVVVEAAKAFASAIVPGNFSAAELQDWIDHSRAFSSIAMHGSDSLTLSTPDGLERVTARTVSADFFRTLGIPMALGRALDDDRDPVMVVSHKFWVRHLAANPEAVGRSIAFTDRTFTIVGVAPLALQFPSAAVEVFTPMGFTATMNPERFANRNRGGFQVFARLKPDVTLAQANVDVAKIHAVLEPHYSESRRGTRVRISSLLTYVTGVSDMFGHRTSVRPVLLVLFAAVGLALFTACANAANLMLARHTARAREWAVRAALGASRGRLVTQSLTESAAIAVAGGIAGLTLAVGAVRVLKYLEPSQLPRLADVGVDGPVLAFAGAVMVATVLLSGLVPAYRAARVDVQDTLRSTSRTQSGDRRARRLRAALVVSEIALGVVLLVGASLLGRSLWRLMDTDLGVNRENVITAFVDLSLAAMPPARQKAVVDTLLERTTSLPGVSAAGVGVGLPPNSLFMRRNFKHPSPLDGRLEDHVVNIVPATPGYFDALGIRVTSGRGITPADVDGVQAVVVITEDAARRYFGDRNPVGLTLPVGFEDGRPVVIAGVVNDVRYTGIDTPLEPVIYAPFAQLPFGMLHVVVRTVGHPLALAADLRALIRSVDPGASLVSVRTMDQVLSEATTEPRFRALFFAILAVAAVLLAAIGLYSVIAYGVSQRTAEFGIRVAVGASPQDIFRIVIRGGALLGVAGAAIGLLAASVMSRALQSLLYGIAPTDLLSYATAASALVVISLVASYVPARRATRADPVVALRSE
jgi:putative ABC transport system permease protein